MGYVNKVKANIAAKRDEAVSFLQRFVKQASTEGNEEGAQQLLADRLREKGLSVDMWEPDYATISKHGYFNSTRTDFTGSPNVVATLNGTGGGRSIILNGHVDVVPAGDLIRWDDDPFSGKVQNGKVYGRGTTDMKGGSVAALIALETVIDLGIPLKGDVIYQSVIEEESGGTGTLAAIERGYRADVALIPEPSEMRILPKQQGSVWFRVTVTGRSAHGGTRYEGVSAVQKGWTVYNELLALEKRRNDRVTDPLYANTPIPIPINVGKFAGGYFPSAVPDQAIIEGRYGIHPEETIEEAKAELAASMEALAQKDRWFAAHPVQVEWFGLKLPPGGMDLDHPFMAILEQQYEAVTKATPVIEGAPWGTDGGLLTTVAGIPSVVFGPGTTRMAHFANEYVELGKLFQTAEVIALTLIDWCGTLDDR